MSVLEDFSEAIASGDSTIAQSMIDSGSVDANARLPCEYNPPALVYAARWHQTAIVDILLRANARIDDVDDYGRTACHVAGEHGYLDDLLALLLARQPNLALLDSNGHSALEYSLRIHRHAHRSLLLLESGAPLTGVNPANLTRFASTSTTAIQRLLDRGVVVNTLRDENSCTPLHVAARDKRDRAVLSMLVNVCGVDLEARNSVGHTCASYATSYCAADALRWLVEAGANIENRDNDGATLLHLIADCESAVVLLAAGADVHARDNRGKTAAHKCNVIRSKLMFVHALLAGGASIDIEDSLGKTARQRLIECGLSVNADHVEQARRAIAKMRLDFVRYRALQVCIGLRSLDLDALQMCEILQFACGPLAPLIGFHQWWRIATTVKHALSPVANDLNTQYSKVVVGLRRNERKVGF